MIKHVSVFTLKDKSEIKHFVVLLDEVGQNCSLSARRLSDPLRRRVRSMAEGK